MPFCDETAALKLHTLTLSLAPSSRTCASLGFADARWFTTSSAAPRSPTTFGMSSSSNPGMPSVNLKIANSSSCCTAFTVGSTRRAGTRAGAAASCLLVDRASDRRVDDDSAPQVVAVWAAAITALIFLRRACSSVRPTTCHVVCKRKTGNFCHFFLSNFNDGSK
jgi:hypothetical protein